MSVIITDEAEPLQLVQPAAYTLTEIVVLASEWTDSFPGIDTTEARLVLSLFIAWLKAREKESRR